ncbi:hypothetical protein BH20VER2_BH20VER2_00600 [soil metagenome]
MVMIYFRIPMVLRVASTIHRSPSTNHIALYVTVIVRYTSFSRCAEK